MKLTSLILPGVLAVGLVVWSQRFDLALAHVRERSGGADVRPASVAWSILDGFADRPELEAFVREQLVATAKTAVGTGLSSGVDQMPLLDLSRHVYERQPERIDAAVVAAGLVVECVRRCSSSRGYENPPAFETSTWTEQTEASDVFHTGMRLAAIALAKYRAGTPSAYLTDSYAGLATALAATVATADPELASSVASFIIAANPGGRETGWLTAALDRIAGPDGAGAAWAMALAEAPTVNLSAGVWDAAVDVLRRSPAPREERLAEALISQCVRRSDLASVDEGCIDVGLAWDAAWTTRLRAASSRDPSDPDVVRALLSAHERERARARTWQIVIAEWRTATPNLCRGF